MFAICESRLSACQLETYACVCTTCVAISTSVVDICSASRACNILEVPHRYLSTCKHHPKASSDSTISLWSRHALHMTLYHDSSQVRRVAGATDVTVCPYELEDLRVIPLYQKLPYSVSAQASAGLIGPRLIGFGDSPCRSSQREPAAQRALPITTRTRAWSHGLMAIRWR